MAFKEISIKYVHKQNQFLHTFYHIPLFGAGSQNLLLFYTNDLLSYGEQCGV